MRCRWPVDTLYMDVQVNLIEIYLSGQPYNCTNVSLKLLGDQVEGGVD
jgi:hypothetical protein